jgi:XTP/dITP diphosphohydrolase
MAKAEQNILLVGTNNEQKCAEIAAMLANLGVRVITPKMSGIDNEPEENGLSFEENALIKARFYSQESGLPCLADDSGLVVDAIDGRPGVYSSRYAPTDRERVERLLAELEGVAEQKRTARFVCVAALVTRDSEIVAEGKCEGRIAFEPHGKNGFGYDPVFYLPELGKTMAELAPSEKNALSHRGRAMKMMAPHLVELFSRKQ